MPILGFDPRIAVDRGTITRPANLAALNTDPILAPRGLASVNTDSIAYAVMAGFPRPPFPLVP